MCFYNKIPSPTRKLQAYARCKGWNLDKRVTFKPRYDWMGDHYEEVKPTVAVQGQRPIVALVGGPGNHAAVQFLQYENAIVGASVVVGQDCPVSGLIHSLGYATTVVLNESELPLIALPSSVFIKNQQSIVVVNADDSVVEAGVNAGATLYGRYHHTLATAGVASLWNGMVTFATKASIATFQPVPHVVVQGQAVSVLEPDNFTYTATHIVLYEPKGKAEVLKGEEAVKKLLEITEGKKEVVIKELLDKATVHVITSAKELSSLLK